MLEDIEKTISDERERLAALSYSRLLVEEKNLGTLVDAYKKQQNKVAESRSELARSVNRRRQKYEELADFKKSGPTASAERLALQITANENQIRSLRRQPFRDFLNAAKYYIIAILGLAWLLGGLTFSGVVEGFGFSWPQLIVTSFIIITLIGGRGWASPTSRAERKTEDKERLGLISNAIKENQLLRRQITETRTESYYEERLKSLNAELAELTRKQNEESNNLKSLESALDLMGNPEENSLTISELSELKRKAKARDERARLKAYEDKSRDGTDTVKSSLLRALGPEPSCPYCTSTINISNCHADHIHPVAKGGLTTNENMVIVCPSCNLKKSAYTLRQFCKNQNFNYSDVCDRLENLGKDV